MLVSELLRCSTTGPLYWPKSDIIYKYGGREFVACKTLIYVEVSTRYWHEIIIYIVTTLISDAPISHSINNKKVKINEAQDVVIRVVPVYFN